MKNQWCLVSLAAVAAISPWAAGQNRDYDGDGSRYEQRRSYEADRNSRTSDNRRSSTNNRGQDANSRPDSNDSWSEWFSDWWSDDSDESKSQTDRSSDRSASRGDRMKTGVQGFVRRHDSNDDGHLSRQELPSNLREGFEDLDRDSNGYLSQSELRQHAQKAISQKSPVVVTYVWVLDANQGRVRLNDLQQAYDALMDVDQDGNGEISRQELRERQQKIASRWIDKCFQQHDENDDDQISRNEARGSDLSVRFEKLDRNNDDSLTRSELRQSVQQNSSGSSDQGSNERQSTARDQDRDRDGERR